MAPSLARSFRASPYDYAAARALAFELKLAEPVAVALVRRGHTTVEGARSFLAAEEAHDPLEFDGMESVCELILSAVAAGRRITVHGDYDVDGVCATAIMVGCLRELGASCDWLIPDRLGDGYGLSAGGIEALSRRGTELIVTVDCGIGSAKEVAAAREAGIEIVVTDHHQPPDRLPDCPLLHPALCGYPFEELCGAGVAHKLAMALRSAEGIGPGLEPDLDLVALATVADVVPLLGENRRLVREGLAAMRAQPRPGLRALMAVSRTDPGGLDAGDLAFRLAPRINAAGRLYRADGGVELMLTTDEERAGAIAAELDRANHERRAAEREALEAAERALQALPRAQADAPALVLAGEGWHRGVVGIVASRLVDRHWRPVIAIGLEGGRGRGSGRSIPGFDLVSALDACSAELVRYGGHAMAAGLEVEAGRIDAFRDAFASYAEGTLDPEALARTDAVDALVGVGEEGIGLELAEQLEALGPFGAANPEPRLLIPAARLGDLRPMGDDGRHSRFQLRSGAGTALGVAFGVDGGLSGVEGVPSDLAVRLELNRWNGAVQPRVVLKEIYPLEGDQPDRDRAPAPVGCGDGCPAPDADWWRRFEAELRRSPGSLPEPVADALGTRRRPRRELVERRGGAIVAAVAELLSSGAALLALCADASRRRELAERAADPRRFGGEEAAVACCRCGPDRLDAALGPAGDEAEPAAPGLVLADWGALSMRPAAARRFEHVLVVDPPPRAELEAIAGLPGVGPRGTTPFAAGFLHLAWGPAEVELSQRWLASEWELRPAIAEIWQALRDAGGELAGRRLASALAGPGRHPRTPEVGARCVRVLDELELAATGSEGAETTLAVVSEERTDLARSATYLACRAEHGRRQAALTGRPEAIAAAA